MRVTTELGDFGGTITVTTGLEEFPLIVNKVMDAAYGTAPNYAGSIGAEPVPVTSETTKEILVRVVRYLTGVGLADAGMLGTSKIAQIKMVRYLTGLMLKESKELVDRGW